MKNQFFAIALSAAVGSLLLTGCGEKTTEKITEVAVGSLEVVGSVAELPKCEKANEGEQILVKGETSFRVCSEGTWISPDDDYASNGGNVPVSCTTQELKDKSGIKIICNGDSIGVVLNGEKGDKGDAGMDGADGVGCSIVSSTDSTATIKCGDDSFTLNLKGQSVTTEEDLVVELPTLSGYSQKGPFVKGASVNAYEMAYGKDLTQTGNNFQGVIVSDSGLFSISNVALRSPYVQLTASGYYRNEVTGVGSRSTLTLNAYTDLSLRANVNVNLLTHLEFFRVKKIMEESDGDLKLITAKRQAEKEIFSQFHIDNTNFGYSEDLNILKTGDQNAALLAISILLQGERSESELTSLLTDFGQDIKADGKWDDATTRAKIADWADSVDLGIGRFKSGTSLELIRQNVAGWKLGTVPDFEKYIRNFWYKEYGLGECNANVAGTVKNITNKLSNFYSSKYEAVDGESLERFICSNKNSSGKSLGEYRWRLATDLEKDTYGAKCPEKAYDWFDGIVISSNKYACEGNGFREITERERFMGKLCLEENADMEITPAESKSPVKPFYTCNPSIGWVWKKSKNFYEKGLKDSRDQQSYNVVAYDDQVWMAENLNYDYNEGSAKSYVNGDYPEYGRYYTWAAAMDSAAVFSTDCAGCGNYVYGYGLSARGVCPEGWHIPSSDEWNTLYRFMGNHWSAMQATGFASWSSATDAYGFSALPAGNYYDGDFSGVGSYAEFWSSTDYYMYYGAYFWRLEAYEAQLTWANKSLGLSIRCLQD